MDVERYDTIPFICLSFHKIVFQAYRFHRLLCEERFQYKT